MRYNTINEWCADLFYTTKKVINYDSVHIDEYKINDKTRLQNTHIIAQNCDETFYNHIQKNTEPNFTKHTILNVL